MVREIRVQTRTADDYDVSGPPEAPAIVLIHGSTVSRQSWLMQVRALETDYRVIALDLPAHGRLADRPFDFDQALTRVRHVIQLEAGGRALVVGLSLGGHVAELFAVRYPKQVAGLVLSGASARMQGLVGLWMRLVGRVLGRMDAEKLKANLAGDLRQKWPAAVAEAQIAAGLFPRGASQSFLRIPKYDYLKLMARVIAPVLILNGELDRRNRKSEAEFAAAAPNARVAVVPGAGHACNVENPEAYNELLRAFAREIGWLPAGPSDATLDPHSAASLTDAQGTTLAA